MTTAHALQTPSTPRNLCSMDAAPILATMPKPAPAKPQAPQMTQAPDQFSGVSGSWSRPMARNHVERVRQYEGIAPRASAGVVTQGQQVWANGAVAAGHDSKTGLTLELMTASLGTGDQTEAEAAFVRVGAQAAKLTAADRKSSIALTGQASVELISGKLQSGLNNADGSRGFNVAASKSLLSAEATVEISALGGVLEGSATIGGGIGAGAEFSFGLRDQDNDGKPEVCARISGKFGPAALLGACLELPKLTNLPRVRR